MEGEDPKIEEARKRIEAANQQLAASKQQQATQISSPQIKNTTNQPNQQPRQTGFLNKLKLLVQREDEEEEEEPQQPMEIGPVLSVTHEGHIGFEKGAGFKVYYL